VERTPRHAALRITGRPQPSCLHGSGPVAETAAAGEYTADTGPPG